jgi:hypothetical protein
MDGWSIPLFAHYCKICMDIDLRFITSQVLKENPTLVYTDKLDDMTLSDLTEVDLVEIDKCNQDVPEAKETDFKSALSSDAKCYYELHEYEKRFRFVILEELDYYMNNVVHEGLTFKKRDGPFRFKRKRKYEEME